MRDLRELRVEIDEIDRIAFFVGCCKGLLRLRPECIIVQ